MATISIGNWDEKNLATVSNLSDGSSFTGLQKAQLIKLSEGSGSGTGDINFSSSTWQNIDSESDIVVTEGDESTTRPYEVESLDTSAREAWIWVYGSWDSDDSEQIVVAAGTGDGTDYSQDGTGANAWSSANPKEVQHLEDDPLTATNSVNGNVGAAVEGATSTTGPINGAASFNGSSDYISGEYSSSEDRIFYYSFFTEADDPSASSIQSPVNDGGRRRVIRINSNEVVLRGYDTTINSEDTLSTSNNVINSGENHYIFAYSDGSNAYIYVDGVLEASGSFESNGMGGNTRLAYGGSGDIDWYPGTIDEFKWGDVVPDSPEIWQQAEFDASPKGGQTFFNWSGPQTTVSAPEVTTDTASNITGEAATISATLEETYGLETEVYFEYRPTGETVWSQTSSQTFSSSGSFEQELTKLNSNTDYEFRAVATNTEGTTNGSIKTFTTNEIFFDVEITSISSINLSDDILNVEYSVENTSDTTRTQDISLNTTIEGDTVVDSNTGLELASGENFEGSFTYDLSGLSTGEEETAKVSSNNDASRKVFYIATKKFLETVDSLEDGEVYEYRAAAEDDSGIDTGTIKDVETIKRDLGTVSSNSISSEDIDQRSIDVSGTVDTVGDYAEVGFDVFFEYRVQGESTWNSTAIQNTSSTGSFSENIAGLTEETTYEIRFAGDFGGDKVTGSTLTATTLAPAFNFTIEDINGFVKEGRTITVDYTVENPGTVSSTQDINLGFDTEDNVVDSNTSVTVSSGGSSTGTLSFDTTGQAEGVYDLFILADEGRLQSTVEILVGSLAEFLNPLEDEVVASRSPVLEYRLDIEQTGTVEIFYDGDIQDTLSAPFDNSVQTTQLNDLDRTETSKDWRITYTGDSPDRDVTRSFIIGFIEKEVDPEQL